MCSTTEELRLTSIWEYSKTWIIFSGVPLDKGKLRTRSGKMIVVVKTRPECLPMQPSIGQHWLIKGKAKDCIVERGGFTITERRFWEPLKLELRLPHDGNAFVQFIANEPDFKGIGEVYARVIWNEFGENIFRILDKKDSQKLGQVLPSRLIDSLLNGYEKYANLRYTTWLAEHLIPPHIQQRLFKFYKSNTIEVIKENPYRLLCFGMNFAKVDSLAKEQFGIQVDDGRRLVAGVDSALLQYVRRGGHTLGYHKDIEGRLRNILGDKELSSKAMHQGYTSQVFKINAETGAYHHTALFIMEQVVAKRLLRLKEKGHQWTYEHDLVVNKAISELPYQLTVKQREAVVSSVGHSVSCISGGAGTGKTMVLRAVLNAYKGLGFDIKAMALSGRAAMRLQESIGYVTSTIAKFLLEAPINCDGNIIVVIDEASMLDIGTMYRIVNHIHPSVRLLYVGDPNQLPPIGAGMVLPDIIDSEVVANVELEVVKRQDTSTGIAEYARLVCRGLVPPQLSTGSITFHEIAEDRITEVCTELYCQAPGISRVIGATKNVVHDINSYCQSILNKHGLCLEYTEFGEHLSTEIKLDDPVLFTRNDYEAGVQNGSLGNLVSVERHGEYLGVVRLDGYNSEIFLTRSLLDSLVLGYAITLHKAQGSQFKRVIVALNDSNMINRAWLYTAITRAEAELHIVGTKKKLYKAINSLSSHHVRKTYLAKLLQK